MPNFNIEIFKSLGFEKWENKYTVSAADMGLVISNVTPLIEAERTLHATNVQFDYARISTAAQGDQTYYTAPLSIPGLRFIAGGQLPLWNVVRVDMRHFAFGAPGRKYYRLPLAEDDTQDGLIGASLKQLVEDTLATMLDDLGAVSVGLIDGSNNSVISFACHNRVTMRKLTRTRRKKTGGLVT